jgi:hypothetical protein
MLLHLLSFLSPEVGVREDLQFIHVIVTLSMCTVSLPLTFIVFIDTVLHTQWMAPTSSFLTFNCCIVPRFWLRSCQRFVLGIVLFPSRTRPICF